MLLAVLLLDRPQQPPRLVEVGVVGPAVQRLEALLAAAGAAAAVSHAVGARAVPGHADEERAVVAVVGRPPVLRGRQHRLDVLLHGVEVERRERLGVVEVRRPAGSDSAACWRSGDEVELLGPPELVRHRPERAQGLKAPAVTRRARRRRASASMSCAWVGPRWDGVGSRSKQRRLSCQSTSTRADFDRNARSLRSIPTPQHSTQTPRIVTLTCSTWNRRRRRRVSRAPPPSAPEVRRT